MNGRYTKKVDTWAGPWGREGGPKVKFSFPEPCPIETFEVASQTHESGPDRFYAISGTYSTKGCTTGTIWNPVFRVGYEGGYKDLNVNYLRVYDRDRNLVCDVEKLIEIVIINMDAAQKQEFMQDLTQYMGIHMPEKYKKVATIQAPPARFFASSNSGWETIDMNGAEFPHDYTVKDLFTALTGSKPT